MDLSNNNSDTIKAFQWWNSQIEGCFDLTSPPQIVSAKIATSIFYKIFPTLMIFDEFNDNDQAYWGEIHRFLNCRFKNIEVPSPSSDFPKFILEIYKLKEKVNPNNIAECFEFMQSYQTAMPAFFLLRQYPIIINNPILYFETIINFSKYNNQLWLTIIKEYRFFDNFFYMNKSYFNHFPKNSKIKDWTIILLCSSAFSKVLSASLEYHTHAFNHSILYIKEIMKYFDNVPDDVFMSLLRDIISVIKSSYQKIALRDKIEPKVGDILHSLLTKKRIFLKIFVKFLISYEPNIVSKSSIVYILTQNEIENISDIEVLKMVCDSTTSYEILVYLSKNMVQSQIFHRSCSSFILDILKQYDKNESIVDYTINFINGLFIFISLSKKNEKFKSRTLFICESLNLFLQSKIYWLQKTIMQSSSTVAQIGYFPCYFDLLFPISFQKDSNFGNLLTTTMNKTKKSKIKLFPFIQSKDEYILFNITNPKNKKIIKRIDDCINSLKTLKTKTKIQNIIHSLGEDLRNLLYLQSKHKHLFPSNFDNILLYLIKIRTKVNMINLYQLIKIVLYFIDDSSFNRVIDFLKFNIETKTFNAIYEFAIITKKYGDKYSILANTAINQLIETEMNSTWAIQTYRRIIKNSKLQNEIVSVIILSSMSSEDEFIKIEAIKTLPYILFNDIDEVAIYKNLKCDLISSNNNILFIASKSLTNTIYNKFSIAKNIFLRLIKKEERLKAFNISFPLFLKHFSISYLLKNLNDWASFLLNLDDSFSLHHISIISKIVIQSFVSILGEKCQMTDNLLNDINNDDLTDKQTVIVLNSFILCHSTSKFILNKEKIFFDALNNSNKDIQILSIQCFESFSKNNHLLGLSFLKKIISNNQNNLVFYQAEAMILKNVSKFVDDEILNSIINDNSINNIIPLSFLMDQQIPEKIYDIDNDDNIFNRILKQETDFNDYLSLFLFMHQKNISEKVSKLIIKNLIDKFETLSNYSLKIIYQISIDINNQELSKLLAQNSLKILVKLFDSNELNFDNYDEFDRKSLYNINSIIYYKDFISLLIEEESLIHALFKQIISSYKKLILNLEKNDRISILHLLFDGIIPEPDNSSPNKNWPLMANLSLISEIICNEFKSQLPSNGLSILLVLQRNRKTFDKITKCISKWIEIYPDSLDICFNSFIYNDAMMFSYFLKHYSLNLNEFAVDTFYVQLKMHFNSNPLLVLKAIPYFLLNKFVTSEMKVSLFADLEELLSYDFLVRPETLRDFYEAINSFSNMIFSKIIMSLLHFPLNSSIATYFGIKLMSKITDKTVFYPILDEIINKNDILNNDCIPNAMNNEILFEALKIRNTIENIPLILLLYQQTNDERVADLIKNTFNLSPEVSQWTSLCKLVVIDKILPINLNDDTENHIQIKPNFLLTKMMLLISKKLVPRIREAYPFQIEAIETIFNIALKMFDSKKHQKMASSILSEILIKIGDVDFDDFILNNFAPIIENIEIVASNSLTFVKTSKLVFNLIDFFSKKGKKKIVSNLIQIVKNNLHLLDNVEYLKTASFLFHFCHDFVIPSDFEEKAAEFIRFVFDKKYYLRNLKEQLACFVEILIKNYPKIIPVKILRILIIEEIYHKCKDYLLLALSVIVDFIYNENEDKTKIQMKTINIKSINNSNSTNIELSSMTNDAESKENIIKLSNESSTELVSAKETNKIITELNNDNISNTKLVSIKETNEINTELSNDAENNANENIESKSKSSNDNENSTKLNSTNETSEINTELNNDNLNNANESIESKSKSRNNNESKTKPINATENNESNIKLNNENSTDFSSTIESNESNIKLINNNNNESTESSFLINRIKESTESNYEMSNDTESNPNLNIADSASKSKIIKPVKNSTNDLTVDEITFVLSKVEIANFERGFGYRCFITSLSRLIPNSIGNKWKTILKILLTSSISSPTTINFECISILLENSRFKIVNEYIPAIFRSICLSKSNENIIPLISLIFDKQTPQMIEALLAELIIVRPYDQSLIFEVMKIVFNILSNFNVSNSVIIDYLKKNVLDLSLLSFVENVISSKKTEKQGVLILIQIFDSISNSFKSVPNFNNTKFNNVFIKLLNLFELFLLKATSLIRKKDLKKIQIDILLLVLDLAKKIDENSKPGVCKFLKCIPNEIVQLVKSKMKEDEIAFLNSFENC